MKYYVDKSLIKKIEKDHCIVLIEPYDDHYRYKGMRIKTKEWNWWNPEREWDTSPDNFFERQDDFWREISEEEAFLYML